MLKDFLFYRVCVDFEVNKSTNTRQNFGSTADLAKKLMYAISACSAWKGPLKLFNVQMFCLFSTNRVLRGNVSGSKKKFFPYLS